MNVSAIVTIPPYAPYIAEVAAHRIVSGLRLNTVMPLKESLPDLLKRLSAFGKPVWVDLKGRQLRVVGAAIPPYTDVQLSHPITVDTPTWAFFSDGRESVEVIGVNGDRILLADGPRRLIGPGESVNIPDPSLRIGGTLTDTDRAYLAAMRGLGLRNVMLSFCEQPADAAEVRALLPDVDLVQKIESLGGIRHAQATRGSHGRLMAARGDLYVEVGQPHRVARAVEAIIAADPDAIVASRLFDSLAQHPVPSSADIGDVAHLLRAGYRTFMLGDTICFKRDSVIEALNLLQALAADLGVGS
jgi:pyruvate kinase